MGAVRTNVGTIDDVRRALNDILSSIKFGTATLSGGTATVTATWIKDDTPVFICGTADASGTEGILRIQTRTEDTSFVITSSEGTDNRVVAWLAITL